MGSTSIEWTDKTWNPVVGCAKCSTGCLNCYALPMARRLAGSAANKPDSAALQAYAAAVDGGKWSGQAVTVPSALEQPLRWRKPSMVFVCSMGDLFHESVPRQYIAAVFGVMAACPQHTFQVLTKRPERMLEIFHWVKGMGDNDDGLAPESLECGYQLLRQEATHHPKGMDGPIHCQWGVASSAPWPLPNVWLGVTAENQEQADKRIPVLLQCPAAVRFVSIEPMLGAVALDLACWRGGAEVFPMRQLGWVICGGESGPGARPMHPDWARSLRDQCQAANVPFLFKQWGEWGPADQLQWMPGADKPPHAYQILQDGGMAWARVGKKAAGRLLDGRTWDQMPGRA